MLQLNLPFSFMAEVPRTAGEKFGVGCARFAESVYLREVIDTGDAAKYNSKVDDFLQLKVGDHLMKVNKLTNSRQMIDKLTEGGGLNLLVVRPYRFEVTVERPEGTPLGLQLHHMDMAAGIVIRNIRDGPVKDYNERTEESMKVMAGDVVEYVNDESGKSGALLCHDLKKCSGSIRLGLMRLSSTMRGRI